MTSGNGQGHAQGKEPVDRVIDLFVHTPIGLAVMAWKRVPGLVTSVPDLVGQALSKGCAQLAEAEARLTEEVRKARMIGEVAVTFGGRQLRREVDARLRDARQAAEGLVGFRPDAGGPPNGAGAHGAPSVTTTETPAEPASPPEPASASKRATTTSGARKATSTRKAPSARKATASTSKKASAKRSSAAHLPILEYDGLSASQVVSRLSGLTPEELRAVRSYEEGSRGRRTVLQAIDRLIS